MDYSLNTIEIELIKKLSLIHFKRCRRVKTEDFSLALSMLITASLSPLINKDTYQNTIMFLHSRPDILAIIDSKCKDSKLHQQPCIYLAYYLIFSNKNRSATFWHLKKEEFLSIISDLKLDFDPKIFKGV
jgi:hypothetical protein